MILNNIELLCNGFRRSDDQLLNLFFKKPTKKTMNHFIKDLELCFGVFLFKELSILFPKNKILKVLLKKKIKLLWTIQLMSPGKITNLNKKHRKKDYLPDVLAFPLETNFLQQRDMPDFMDEYPLGDICISYEKLCIQAIEYDVTPFEELLRLVIHGYLHLLGFDHEISLVEEKKMFSLENKLFQSFFKKNNHTQIGKFYRCFKVK